MHNKLVTEVKGYKMYIQAITRDSAFGIMPHPLVAEESEDTPICPTCKGNKTLNGQFCPTCHGIGYSDRQPLRLEEEEEEQESGDTPQPSPADQPHSEIECPHCERPIVIETKVVH